MSNQTPVIEFDEEKCKADYDSSPRKVSFEQWSVEKYRAFQKGDKEYAKATKSEPTPSDPLPGFDEDACKKAYYEDFSGAGLQFPDYRDEKLRQYLEGDKRFAKSIAPVQLTAPEKVERVNLGSLGITPSDELLSAVAAVANQKEPFAIKPQPDVIYTHAGHIVKLPQNSWQPIEDFKRRVHSVAAVYKGQLTPKLVDSLEDHTKVEVDAILRHHLIGSDADALMKHFPKVWPYPITKSEDLSDPEYWSSASKVEDTPKTDVLEKAEAKVSPAFRKNLDTLVNAFAEGPEDDGLLGIRLPKEVAAQVLADPQAAINALKEYVAGNLVHKQIDQEPEMLYELARSLLWSEKGISIGSLDFMLGKWKEGDEAIALTKAYEDTLVQTYVAMDAALHSLAPVTGEDLLPVRDARCLLELAQTGIRYALPKLVPTHPAFIDQIGEQE